MPVILVVKNPKIFTYKMANFSEYRYRTIKWQINIEKYIVDPGQTNSAIYYYLIFAVSYICCLENYTVGILLGKKCNLDHFI